MERCSVEGDSESSASDVVSHGMERCSVEVAGKRLQCI